MERQQTLLQPLILKTSAISSASSTHATTLSLPPSSSATNSGSAYRLRRGERNRICGVKTFVCSNSPIVIRLLAVLLTAAISIWANYEASKSFEVKVINDADGSPAGQRFHLFYVSDDRAVRMLLDNSLRVEKLLYPNANLTKKKIDNVTLRLAARNLAPTSSAALISAIYGDSDGRRAYVMDLSPSLLEASDVHHAMESAIRRALVRIWLWDGDSRAPTTLLDGLVEYITDLIAGVKISSELRSVAGCSHPWWAHENSRYVSSLLRACEEHSQGFIQRLNQAMKNTWHDHMIDDALGMQSNPLCRPSFPSSSPAFRPLSSS